jgi:hypothetical protein
MDPVSPGATWNDSLQHFSCVVEIWMGAEPMVSVPHVVVIFVCPLLGVWLNGGHLGRVAGFVQISARREGWGVWGGE